MWQFLQNDNLWLAFWPSVFGAFVGAIAAFVLEYLRRKREQISNQVGQCNKLIFILAQMQNTLEDIYTPMFEERRRKLSREPEWYEIGAIESAPDHGPEFIIGEYTFLLERKVKLANVPNLLGQIYTAESNFKSILALIKRRNDLFHEYLPIKAANVFRRGEEAASGSAESEALAVQLKENTSWLAKDLPEAISFIKRVSQELHQALAVLYPKRDFIYM